MKIIYTCNFTKSATNGDKNLFYGKGKNVKNLNVKDVLEISLQNFYKNKDVRKNLLDFISDFQKLDEFQMCYLDALHKLPRTVINDAKKNAQYKNKIINNIVLIGKKNDYKWEEFNAAWEEFNAAAIFCDLNIKSDNNKNVSVFFEIRRIEFLDLPYLEKNNAAFVGLRSVEFTPYNPIQENNYYEHFKNVSDIQVLSDLEHCINVFSNDDEPINSFSNDVNKLNLWWRVIKFLNRFISDERNNSNYLFSFESYDINDLFSKDFYLFSKQQKLNTDNLINFIYSKDESISFKVITNVKESIDNFSGVVANKIQKATDSQKNLLDDVLTYNKELDDTKKEIKNVSNSLDKCKKNINVSMKELETLKNEKQKFLDSIESKNEEENDLSEKDKQKLAKMSEAISISSKRIENFNENFKSLEDIKQTLENQKKDLEENISTTSKKINKFDDLILNLNLLKSFFDNNTYNAFKASISLFDDEEDINLNFIQDTYFDLESADGNLSVISEDVNGFRQKIKRYQYAIQNAIDGNYRNPYLLYSINETPNIEVYKELPNTIIDKYQLNDKQKAAVKGAISTRDTFYIQGPPGTGKTQVISAISEIIASKEKNILMTSSTHEAISNFFDRLNDSTNDNPNVIMLKNKVLKEDRDLYSESHLYLNFINRIRSYIVKEKNKNNPLLEKIKNIKNVIPEKAWNYKEYLSTNHIDELVNKLFDKESLNEFDNSLIKEFLDDEYVSNIEILLNQEKTQVKKDLSSFRNRKYRKFFIKELNLDENIVNEIKQIHDEIYNGQKRNVSIKEFYNNLNSFDTSKSIEKVKEFFLKKDDEKIKDYEKEFKDFVFKNNLINIIGITTTANTEITIDRNIKNLFFEYPIDTVIVDEISKSSTPEILARVILSKKVIFAGDYKQLPPANDVDESLVEKIVKNNDKDYLYGILDIFGVDYNGAENDFKNIDIFFKREILKNFENLFKTSFFSNQVKKIKSKSKYSINRIYEFLNIQHRFTEKIMNLVNINYEISEKLKMPENFSEFKKYGFILEGKDYINYDTILVDTTLLNKETISKFSNFKVKTKKQCAFDQKKPIIYKGFSQKESGLFNEYNAEIDLLICNELLKYSSEDLLKNKIGIICLTANQKKLIKYILGKNPEFSNLKKLNIKIDTIDNFQGREKEIILVDFVRAKGKYENGSVKFEDKRNLDFISSIERNNVALSRAKNKLILIGSFRYYVDANTNSNIKKLSSEYIQNCEEIILN